METLFVAKDAKLERKESTLLLRTPTATRRFPVESVRHIVLLGEAQLTSAVLSLCGRAGVRITVLDWFGNVTGSFEPFDGVRSGAVRLAQAAAVLDNARRMSVAREIVAAAVDNLIANLRYRVWRGNAALTPVVERMSARRSAIAATTTTAELMGVEGGLRASYYEAWPLVDVRLSFGPRRRRPPNNRLNCLMSWFNGLAYAAMRHEIGKTHLEPAFSFLHSPNEARHSLALDLAEPFKPVAVDTLIFQLALRDQLDDGWFAEEAGVCRLTEVGRRATLEAWAAKLDMPGASGRSLRDNMRAEALGIERHVLGLGTYSAHRRKV